MSSITSESALSSDSPADKLAALSADLANEKATTSELRKELEDMRAELAKHKQPRDRKKKYLILALDGGGMRGVLTLHILKRIEDEFPGFCRSAHLLAGSSTG